MFVDVFQEVWGCHFDEVWSDVRLCREGHVGSCFFDINRLRFVVLGGTAIAIFGIACGGPEVIALGFRCFLGVYLLFFMWTRSAYRDTPKIHPLPLILFYLLY